MPWHPAGAMSWLSSQAEVDTERAVEFGYERHRQLTQSSAYPLNGHGTDLLGLGLGIVLQPGLACWQEDLERVDSRDV
jgi:hypothetical protein